MRRILTVICLIMIALGSAPAVAGSYQMSVMGRLTQDDGRPVVGPVDVEIAFFTTETGTTGKINVGPLIYPKTSLADGIFQVNLDLTAEKFHQIFAQIDQPVFFEVTDLSSGKIYRRQKYNVVPYALKVPVDDTTIGYNSAGELSVIGSPATFSGSLAGDVTGTQNATVVSRLNGKPLATTAPVLDQVLKWNGTAWAPAADDGSGAALSDAGSLTTGTLADARLSGNVSMLGPTIENSEIVDGAVTPAKLSTSGCLANHVMKFNGSVWACALDDDTNTPTTNAGDLTFGTLPDARLPAAVSRLGAMIDGTEISASSIATTHIVDGAVTPLKLAAGGCSAMQVLKFNGSVWECAADVDTNTPTTNAANLTTGLLDEGRLTAAVSKLGQTIDGSEIASLSIGTGHLIDNAVTPSKLAPGGCASGQVLKFNGTAWACAADIDTNTPTVDAGSLTAGTLNDLRLSANVSLLGQTITSSEIVDGTIVGGDLANNAVGDAQVAAGIDAAKIGGGVISNAEFANLESTTGPIQGQLNDRVVKAGDQMTGPLTLNPGGATGAIDAVVVKNSQKVRFENELGTPNTVTFRAPTGAFTNQAYILPVAPGTSGQVLKTDGSGNLGWITPGTDVTLLSQFRIICASGLILKSDGGGDWSCQSDSTSGGGGSTPDDNSVSTLKIVDGAVTAAKLNAMGCFNGQILKFDGTAWLCSSDDNNNVNPDASLLTTGTLPDARLSSSVSLLGQSIESADLADQAVGSTKLGDSSVTSLKIADATIVNADIHAFAAIEDTKLATIATIGKVADSALSDNISKLGSDIDLASGEASGVLPVLKGGTGATTLVGLVSGGAGGSITDASIVNADVATGADIDAAKIGTGAVDNTHFNYLAGVTSDIQAQINAKGGVSNVTGNLPISVASGTSTPVVSIAQATTSANGYLTSADWNTFNGKVSTSRTISPGTGLTGGGDLSADRTLTLGIASNSTIGGMKATTGKITLDGTGVITNIAADSAVSVTGTVAVANGGTGATAAPAARTNLGAAASGDNSDISSLSLPSGSNRAISVQSVTSGVGNNLTVQAGNTTAANTSGGDLVLTSGLANGSGSSKISLQTATGTTRATKMTILGNGNVGIGTTSPSVPLDVDGALRLQGDTAGYVTFAAASSGVNTSYTWPSAAPTAGSILKSDASGVLSWTSQASLASAFSSLADGTNTTADMLVGSGATLAPTGTGAITANKFKGTGTSTDAVDLATAEVSGTLPIAKGGTNSSVALSSDRIMISSGGAIVEAGAMTHGQLLIGSTGTAPVRATLTGTTNQISVTNAAGSITLSTPQSIHAGASPTFNNLTLSSLTLTTDLTVANGGTGLSGGTSGGIPYYSNATTMASSGVLTIDGVVLGGGAAAAPKVTAAGAEYNVLRVPVGGGAPAFGPLHVGQAAAVTGILSVTNGGTGASTLAGNGVLVMNAAGTAATSAAASAIGNVLTSDGTTWSSQVIPWVSPGAIGATSPNTGSFTTLTTSGNVGIGTSSPTTTLDVEGVIRSAGGFRFPDGTTMTTAAGLGIGMSSPNDINIAADNVGTGGGAILMATHQVERVRITNDGDVGIGTSNPTTLLDVNGAVTIRGGTPGIGKVLTSVDSAGRAAWQAPGGAPNGVVYLTTTGSGTFVVPLNVTKIWVRAWGGGGSGACYSSPSSSGNPGGNTTFLTLNAGGGGAGTTSAGGAGGTASGGDINETGQKGSANWYSYGPGGAAARGGAGGWGADWDQQQGNDGTIPGGGGSAAAEATTYEGGGGGGGYSEKLFTVAPGASISYFVGAGGAPVINCGGGSLSTGAGARGEVILIY